MKILMLTPYLPYPLWSGGQIRTYNLLKHLSRKHDITLFSFIRSDSERKYIPELKKYCPEVEVFLKRPPWSITSLALSAVTFYPLVVCMYLNGSLRQAIAKAIERKKFDIIHAETFYVMPNIPKKSSIPIILVEQTIEYLVYKHYTQNVGFWPKKLLMDWDVIKIRYWEENFWKKAMHVVAMSSADKNIMQELIPDLKVDLVPNGVDTQFFSFRKTEEGKKRHTVLFIGNFKWLQNREAVWVLVSKIWPKVLAKLPYAKLWIVGRFPPKDILKHLSSSISVSDNIDDIRDAYAKADILLAPIYGPGGTRYKILESMATGLPVVTTPTGIEGLDAENGNEVIVCDNADDLAWQTVHALTDANLYGKLAQNGRKLVEKKFNWDTISAKLDEIYQNASFHK